MEFAPLLLRKTLKPEMLPGFSLIETCKFRFRTLEDIDVLAQLAAEMFREPRRVHPGLYELLLNAVEHGCLGIGHDLKSKLLDNGTWEEEVKRRLSLPENRAKQAELVVARKKEGSFAVITDPGPGFDWKAWITADPARAGASHGRGIVKARGISFDGLTFNKTGNQAVALCRDAPDIIW